MKLVYWMTMALLVASFVGCSEKADLEALAQASGGGDAGAPEPPQPGAPAGAAAQKGPVANAVPAGDGAAVEPAPQQAAPDAKAGFIPNEAAGNGGAAKAAPGVVANAPNAEMPANYLEALTYALFNAEHRLIFEAQIPQALNLYKAAHDNKGPASTEEFLTDIIDANGIDLPSLAPGDRYHYDPKLGKLVIIHN